MQNVVITLIFINETPSIKALVRATLTVKLSTLNLRENTGV